MKRSFDTLVKRTTTRKVRERAAHRVLDLLKTMLPNQRAAGYAAMAADLEREREANEWTEASLRSCPALTAREAATVESAVGTNASGRVPGNFSGD